MSLCALSSAILKIIHTAYCKPKLLKVSKVSDQMGGGNNDEARDFYMNKVTNEPKSSLIRRKDKTRARARTESTGPALDSYENNHIDISDDDKKVATMNEFFKKPYKNKKNKKKK